MRTITIETIETTITIESIIAFTPAEIAFIPETETIS